MAPLWPDKTSLAALQAQILINNDVLSKKDMYSALSKSITNAKNNPNALVTSFPDEDEYFSADQLSSPLSFYDCAPISDGASAMIIGTKEVASKLGLQKVKISNIHHSIESSNFGARDLSTSQSLIGLNKKMNLSNVSLDFVELHTQFTYEIPFIRKLLDLGDIDINLSGGPLAGNVMMAAGLDSIGKAYEALKNQDFHHGLAHATSGPCLQQNMLVHLEKLMIEAAVIGVGQTKYDSKRRDVSMGGLVRKAIDKAMLSADVDWDAIDAVILGKAPDMFEGVMMPELSLVDAIGANGKPLLRVHTAGSVGGSTAVIAASHVCSGNFDTVLTVTYEKQSESNATWALSPKYPYSPHINAGAGGYFAPYMREYIRRYDA